MLSYRKFSTTGDNGPLTNEQFYYTVQSNHTLALPSKVRLEIELRYLGPTASGLYQLVPMHWVGLALKKSILKEKLDVGLHVNEFNQCFCFRTVGFSLRYSFSRGRRWTPSTAAATWRN